MILAAAVLLTVGAIVFTLFIRTRDLPEPEPVSPWEHLELRKAQIYENLRDLQFEYRVGKLSDADYQQTKVGLQTELAGVLAEIDKLKGTPVPPLVAAKKAEPAPGTVCPHCGAKFPKAMKFCGECGKGDDGMKTLLFLLAPVLMFAVDGVVTNQTTGKPQPNVILQLIQPGQGGMQTLGTAKTDAAGKFTFTQSTGENPALIQAIYGGVTYTRMLQPGAPSTGVQVEVFDATNKRDTVELNQHMVLLQPSSSALQVNEMFLLRNTGKTTFNDPAKGSLQFYAPAGHGDIRITVSAPGGMPVQRTATPAGAPNTLKIDFPVKPGETRFDIVYSIDGPPGEFAGKRLVKGGETRLVVPGTVSIEGAGIEQLGTEPQTQAKIFSVKADTFNFKISGTGSIALEGGSGSGGEGGGQSAEDDEGRPQIQQSMPRLYDQLWLVLALAAGVLAVGFILLYRSNKA